MIRNEATQTQVDAADPQANTWLTANAGSGKTRVLTDRVARLLLDGVDPQNILCLTYTKAAASEMQNRLFRRLGKWSMLSDAELRNDLDELGVEDRTGQVSLPTARRLFARAIETPGGLKIQTIHSFCSSILRRFPLEAHVSPQFKELDEVSAKALQQEVLDEIADGPKAQVFRDFLFHFGGGDLEPMMASILKNADVFDAPFDPVKTKGTLNLPSSVTEQSLLQSVFTHGWDDMLKRVCVAMQGGSDKEQGTAQKIALLAAEAPSTSLLERLESIVLFGPKTKRPFGAKVGSLPNVATQKAHPDLMSELNPFMEAVEAARDHRLALQAFERAEALHHFGELFCKSYATKKLALGLLDFDDLITKALALFQDPKVAQWVLFRIDGGIDHLLVDEAQDTSPTQWAVIRALTEEFTSGQSARGNIARTIFVVGDKKQSIYSFQGADPREFDRMQAHFDQALINAQQNLATPALQHSFRSAAAILRFVDEVFIGELGPAIGGSAAHVPFHDDMPGRVDLWPHIEATKDDDGEGEWFNPIDQLQDTHHTVQLAERIAGQIQHMISHESLPKRDPDTGKFIGRKITEGDFLILVQRRSELFTEIIRACKSRGLRIAGADRLELTAELAVKDILAVLSFLALPEDSLSLASALKSPLFGWSEAELYALAHHRTEDYLWQALRDSDKHPQTLEVLNDLRSKSDFLRPYELIERLLTKHNGREKLLSRLGMEAADGIDALLAQALKYESNGTPSLTGFLCWMEVEAAEIKRQMDTQSDEIRVMTVHGAKGLEAPIVILPDTGKRKNQVKEGVVTVNGSAFMKTSQDAAPKAVFDAMEEMKERQEAERMRLLYVAMTRAENWLVLCGAGDVGKDGESWFKIAEATMAHMGNVDCNSDGLEFQRFETDTWPAVQSKASATTSTSPVSAPTFATPAEPLNLAPLSPSDLGGAKALPGEVFNEEDGMARGRVIHTLLEYLPSVPAEQRQEMSKRLVQSHPDGHLFDEPTAGKILDLIADTNLDWVFANDALAEVPITAELPELDNRKILGLIDRLIVTDTSVTAIDFKSNATVPQSPNEVPEGLRRQMGAYAAALKQIYPTHSITTGLLWTETGEVMMLPDDLVSKALSRVNVP